MRDEPKAMKRMREKARNVKGKWAERRVARNVGGKRVGGPGKTDVVKGRAKYEVKHRKTKVTKPELKKFRMKHGTTQVVSKGGFTKPAKQYAKKKRMKLYEGTYRMKPVKHGKKKKAKQKWF